MPGMTPGRPAAQRGTGPQVFTPRAGSRLPGQVRRALDGHILTSQRNGESLEVNGGRLDVRAARGGGLVQSREGLKVDLEQTGEKNRAPIDHQNELASTATAAQIAAAYNALLAQLKKTGRMR